MSCLLRADDLEVYLFKMPFYASSLNFTPVPFFVIAFRNDIEIPFFAVDICFLGRVVISSLLGANHLRYLPINGARTLFRSAGISAGSVMMACSSAPAHPHPRF
jgi:hypothetical protein